MIKVRFAREEDIERIAAIDKMCAEQPWSAAQLREELTLPHARLLAAERDGEVVGFCDMHIASDDAHINEISVMPQHRRLGIARALLEEAEALCASEKCARLTLEVRSRNLPAKALYEKMGLAPCGVRRRFYTDPDDDAVVMLKNF